MRSSEIRLKPVVALLARRDRENGALKMRSKWTVGLILMGAGGLVVAPSSPTKEQPHLPSVSAYELRSVLAWRESGYATLGISPLDAYPSSVIFQETLSIQKGIYGGDDRVEVKDAPAGPRLNGTAVAAVVSAETLDPTSSGWRLAEHVPSFERRAHVCPEEPFREQPAAAECTAFLTKANVVVTAAHCVAGDRLDQWRFVFGYQLQSATAGFSSAAVYSGKRIVGRAERSDGTDWAVVELDRAVVGINPLRCDQADSVRQGAGVYVIGCPAGLPLKYAGNAAVRSFDPDRPYFVTNLDTYGGNSGSPVFSASTDKVIGILVRGDPDFSRHDPRGCARSLVCPNTGCGGEEVMRLALVPDQLWR
jgi:hypothetical protein